MRALQAVIDRLEARALGVEGETIFAGPDVDLPGIAGAFLTLTETGGRGPLTTHNAGSLRQPWFQVTARGDVYPEAAALADAAWLALGGDSVEPIVNVFLGDVFFLWMRPVQEPFQLPNDANGRARLTFNVAAVRR